MSYLNESVIMGVTTIREKSPPRSGNLGDENKKGRLFSKRR